MKQRSESVGSGLRGQCRPHPGEHQDIEGERCDNTSWTGTGDNVQK